MTPEQHKIRAEFHLFMADNPWASQWDFENYRAHKLSKGKLPDPRKSEQFLVKKLRYEVRCGKAK